MLHAGSIDVMLIKQREKTDCAICTIAMALGRHYEEVLEAALAKKAYEPGVGVRAEYQIIEAFGLKQMRDFRTLHRGGEQGILSPAFFRHLTWGRRAILAVPSLNIPNGFHSVYWSGSTLFDPCLMKTYESWEALQPDELILFAENGAHPGR